MVPPLASLGPEEHAAPTAPPHPWTSRERQAQLRSILLGVVLFVGLVVWIFHSIAASGARPPEFVHKLRVVGVLTWIYALVQLVDTRFYHSRFAQRRQHAIGLPENILGWLFGQMLAWFGIVYYALTADLRWYVAGLVLVALTFWGFPLRTGERN